MWCIAICDDAPSAAAERSRLFEAHVTHNVAHIAATLFAAPLASADGATGIGDDPNLRGSVYCLDVADLAAARRIMESDPFAAGVWGAIAYYEWQAPTGAWLDPQQRPEGLSADYRCYLAVARSPLEVSDALVLGAVRPVEAATASGDPLACAALLRADSLDQARRQAAGAEWVAAAPVAIGRWVRIASVADVVRTRQKAQARP